MHLLEFVLWMALALLSSIAVYVMSGCSLHWVTAWVGGLTIVSFVRALR
ncbi:hypothetical protein [Stenotrophomonas sp. NPDC078853]